MPRKSKATPSEKDPNPSRLSLGRALLPLSASGGGKQGFVQVDGKDDKKGVIHPTLLYHPMMGMAFAGYTPLPSRLRVKMKYVTYAVLSAGVTPGVYVLSANGLYDPDITGAGHQPRGFDQLIALYDHYVVTHSTCAVEFTGSLGSTQTMVAGVQLQSSSTTQSDYIDYAEQAQCEFSFAPIFVGGAGAVQAPRMHKNHCDVGKFMGIPDPLTATKLQGSVSANPQDQAFFHVFAQHLDGSTSSVCTALISLEYDATFIEPVPVASS